LTHLGPGFGAIRKRRDWLRRSSGRRIGLRLGIGPRCQERLHALAAPAGVVLRRIDLQRLVKISDRMIGIVPGLVGFAAVVVGPGIFDPFLGLLEHSIWLGPVVLSNLQSRR
jgi:hypothetical protein